jgi:type I site-specific restriction-modification system R (restriction) subunit
LEIGVPAAIADEAHRSQHGFGGKVIEKTGEMSCGFALNLRVPSESRAFLRLMCQFAGFFADGLDSTLHSGSRATAFPV